MYRFLTHLSCEQKIYAMAGMVIISVAIAVLQYRKKSSLVKILEGQDITIGELRMIIEHQSAKLSNLVKKD